MAEKATLYLENNKGMILDFTRSPQACDVYDLDGNLISGGGGGGSNIPTITLNIHNIGENTGDIPVDWKSILSYFMAFENGYLHLDGIDTGSSVIYDINEIKSYLSVPVTTQYLDNGNLTIAGGFGFVGYTPDNPISAISDLVNCTIQQFEDNGENYWCLLITDITKDASATINLEMVKK